MGDGGAVARCTREPEVTPRGGGAATGGSGVCMNDVHGEGWSRESSTTGADRGAGVSMVGASSISDVLWMAGGRSEERAGRLLAGAGDGDSAAAMAR